MQAASTRSSSRAAADVDNLASLDQKLWVALACPTRGLEIDRRTLELIDTDKDERIRPPEILGAVTWARDVFRTLDDLFKGGDKIPLASINDKTQAGQDLLAGAKRILTNLGHTATADAINLAEVADTQREDLRQHALQLGDGIVPVESAEDDDTKAAITDVIAALGSVPDRSGKPGIDKTRSDAFFARVKVFAAWVDEGDAVRTLGDGTTPAAAALSAVRSKIDDFFVRCRLAGFDGRNPAEVTYSEEQAKARSPGRACRARGPRRRVDAARAHRDGSAAAPRRAQSGVGDAHGDVRRDRGHPGARPVRGRDDREGLGEPEGAALAPYYDAWLAKQPADDGHEEARRRAHPRARAGDTETRIADLIARDAAVTSESNQIEAVEKMLRLRRDFVALLRNFVSFADFYRTRLGAFQVGTLYVDGRSCDASCMFVDDPVKHMELGALSKSYLVYCEVTRKKDVEKRSLVAAVTAGDVDNLMMGRNGASSTTARATA